MANNKYENVGTSNGVVHQHSQQHYGPSMRWHFLLLFALLLIIVPFIFLYNYALSLKMSPIFIHQKDPQDLEDTNKKNLLAMRDENAKLTRQLEKDLAELFYSVPRENRKIHDQMIRLLAISRQLSHSDGANGNWHKIALSKLGAHTQNALQMLQNPSDCQKARILVAKWGKNEFGFGCIMHFISFALTIAVASNRTLLFDEDGAFWGQNGWNAIFEPISRCKYGESIDPASVGRPFPQYEAPDQSERILAMPSRWHFGGFRDILHMPPIVPNEYWHFLHKHHTNPPAWFLGQIMKYVWRPNGSIMEEIGDAEKALHFGKGPIVGVHVRRTDKKLEADFYALEEYMKWVEHWYEVEDRVAGRHLPRRLFLATDDPGVILEARKKYGGNETGGAYEINAFDQNAQIAANIGARYSTVAMKGFIADIHMLIRCDFVVCTFSSNICRLVYELMQVLHGNAGDRVKSLDFYYDDYYLKKNHFMEATDDYSMAESAEIEAVKGDKFGVSKVFWNGTVAGRNLATGKSGLFPAYLLKDHHKNASFPLLAGFNEAQ